MVESGMTVSFQRVRGGLAAFLTLVSLAPLAAPLPGGFQHSGWYQFEVVVMVDTRAETLESETWPLIPTVGYPARWRWLRDTATQRALESEYPDAVVTSSHSGHLTVRLPAPQLPAWEPDTEMLTEGDMSLIDDLIEISQGSDTFALLAEKTGEEDAGGTKSEAPRPLLPFEQIAPVEEENSPLLALESLGVAMPNEVGADAPINIPFAPEVNAILLDPISVDVEAIPTPAPFLQRPLDQLAPGLARYRRSSEDDVIAAVSWLQGPDSDTLPILLETDSDSGYPVLQGFIQLVPRGDSWRLGLNFWANTHGHYLPEIFDMPGPPASPRRIAVLAPAVRPNLETRRGTDSSEQQDTLGGFLWTSSGDAVSDSEVNDASMTAGVEKPPNPEWPWRHLVRVADTIPLTENRLRYYDHPVIKVLAIWRELSWYELFIEGQALMNAPADISDPIATTLGASTQ
jgi:hypothetical protein